MSIPFEISVTFVVLTFCALICLVNLIMTVTYTRWCSSANKNIFCQQTWLEIVSSIKDDHKVTI